MQQRSTSSSGGTPGIKGAVFIGPLCAVPPPGHHHCANGRDVRTYSAPVRITRLSDGRVFKVTSRADGRFFLSATPGVYRVRAMRQDGATPPPARRVVVRKDRVSDVILDYDNGIA